MSAGSQLVGQTQQSWPDLILISVNVSTGHLLGNMLLGTTDFDFDNFYFLESKFLDFTSPGFQVPRNMVWAGLGPGSGRTSTPTARRSAPTNNRVVSAHTDTCRRPCSPGFLDVVPIWETGLENDPEATGL